MKRFSAQRVISSVMSLLVAVFALGSSPALAQSTPASGTRSTFSIGASLGGQGAVIDLFAMPPQFPSNIGASLRLEWLDFLAQGMSLRADFGSQALEIGPMWRLDLSDAINLTISTGFGFFDWSSAGLYGRFGLEYEFVPGLAATLELGARSKIITAPDATNSFNVSWLLGVVYFL